MKGPQPNSYRLCMRFVWLTSFVGAAIGFTESHLERFKWTTKLDFKRVQDPLDQSSLLPMTTLLQPTQDLSTFRTRFLSVSQKQQLFNGVRVEGAWTQSLFNPQGGLIEIQGQRLTNISDSLAILVSQALLDTSFRLEELRRRVPHFRLKSHGWRLSFARNNKPDLLFVADLLSETEDEWIEESFSTQRGSWSRRRIQFGASEATAVIFPLGPAPQLLPAQLVHLQQLNEDGELSHPGFRLYSQDSNLKLWNSHSHFEFATDDPRLDLLQVHYGLYRGLDWFDKTMGAKLSMPLDVKVHVGHQSNAAFYFKNRLRFGSGDNQEFRALPQDPSIVMHELAHAFIEKISGINGTSGESGALCEAFADFFAATILDSPFMGQSSHQRGPFLRSLEQQNRYEDFKDKGIYPLSTVASGLLWDLRTRLGVDLSTQLAVGTLARLGPAAQFSDFAKALRDARPDGVVAEDLEQWIQDRGL